MFEGLFCLLGVYGSNRSDRERFCFWVSVVREVGDGGGVGGSVLMCFGTGLGSRVCN